jgi:protein TonB
VLRIHVGSDGRVTDILVERSAGHAALDEAAKDAVSRWHFEPGRRGRDPVAMWVLLPVEFRLR